MIMVSICFLPEFLAIGQPTVFPTTSIGRLMENQKDVAVWPVASGANIVDPRRKLSSINLYLKS